MEKIEEAKLTVMTRKTRIRKELAFLTGERLKAAERELAGVTKEEDKGYATGAANISLSASSFSPLAGLQMSPQEWALKDGLPRRFWSSPGPQTRVDDDCVLGELEVA